MKNTVGYSFYANHSQDGAMDVRWLENVKYYFYKKMHNFLMFIIVSRTYHNSYKRGSNKYRKVENVSLKHTLCF